MEKTKPKLSLHSLSATLLQKWEKGPVVQLVRIRACHARGRGFESRPDRKKLQFTGAFLFMAYYVYIIRSQLDNTLYKGSTSNVSARIADHNLGKSRYTSKKLPWKLVYQEELESKTSALIRERQLKRCNRAYLEQKILNYSVGKKVI